MKKLILLLFIPVVCLGQDVDTKEYYDNGQKIIEKTWQDNFQTKTLIEIGSDNGSGYKYFINEKGVEVGVNFYVVRDYGKYFKVELSLINNSKDRLDFLEKDIYVSVNGKVKNKEKYYAIPFNEYKTKVARRQNLNNFLNGVSIGVSNATAGTTYSQSNSYYTGNNGTGNIYTNTTSYSPALAIMQYQQNVAQTQELQNNQEERKNYINEGYIKNHTIFPNTVFEGYFLIKYNRNITDIDIVIKLGDMEFDFSNDRWNLP
jgi:hypothetical protein